MIEQLTVSQAAHELEIRLGKPVRPRVISDLFYDRRLPDELGPIVGGRRLIAREALDAIERILCDHPLGHGKDARDKDGRSNSR
jgi:hypothetical protein